jgi:hypothetical protein
MEVVVREPHRQVGQRDHEDNNDLILVIIEIKYGPFILYCGSLKKYCLLVQAFEAGICALKDCWVLCLGARNSGL